MDLITDNWLMISRELGRFMLGTVVYIFEVSTKGYLIVIDIPNELEFGQ